MMKRSARLLCKVGKSASRQSALQCSTGAGTCNVDHDAQSRTAAATARTSDAATSILSLALQPQPVTQQKANRPSKYVWAHGRRQGISKVFVACLGASVTSVLRKEHNKKTERTQQKNPACSAWLATQWRWRDRDVWCWRLSCCSGS